MKPLAHVVLAFAAPLLIESESRAATPPAAPARDTTARAQLLASAITPKSASLALVPWMRANLNLVGASGETRFAPPRVERGPQVDGSLDDEVWSRAAVLRSFTHTRPVEGVADSLGTVALVLYDDHNLYVAFHAGDDPRKVQAPVVPRDQIGQGDWVGVSIDTYHDRQRSFFLCSNPLGIQMDGIDQEGRDSDMAPDFQYTSRGHVTADGYDVEMAIPFKTLRFTPGERVEFGFQAIRDVRRDGTHMYWAPVSRDINSYHTQIGTLENLEEVRPGRNVEVNPTHSTTTLGERSGDRLRFVDPQGSFGLGVKVGVTSNLTADATMTPDFSQIEADAGVVDINERFALFFDEKRPFFLEGSDIFASPISLVYTRRIVDPLYGAKLTGKVGRTSIGFLNAADRSVTRGVDGLPTAVNPYADHQALYTIARFKRDVLKNSYLGLLAGDRTHHDQYNRGLGLDGRLNWRDRYSFSFQGAQSWARDPDYRGAVASLSPTEQADVPDEVKSRAGASTQGNAWRAELGRDTRKLNTGIRALSFSPEFAADMGFVNRLDQLSVSGWFRPHLWARPGQWYTGFHAPIYYERIYSHGGDRLTDEALSMVQEIDLPRNSSFGMENVRRFIRHNGDDFADLYRHAVWAETGRYRTVRPGGLFVWGDQVVFAETVRGHDQRWELWGDIRFGSQFDGSLFVTGSTVWRDAADARFAQALIQRIRLSYQFNKELSLRWITELRQRKSYDATGALTGKTQTLTPDVLLSYYVRPGTVVYLGYGSILAGRETRDLTPARSSFFTKLSYLWQL